MNKDLEKLKMFLSNCSKSKSIFWYQRIIYKKKKKDKPKTNLRLEGGTSSQNTNNDILEIEVAVSSLTIFMYLVKNINRPKTIIKLEGATSSRNNYDNILEIKVEVSSLTL